MYPKMTMALVLVTVFSAGANARYLSPSPWTITVSPAANITQAATLLLPRQDSDGAVTVWANGQFLDSDFASLFACASTSSSPPPPPPSPSPSPSPDNGGGQTGTGLPPPPPPSPTPASNTANCNTADRINDVELERGANPHQLSVDDMRDLFTDQCGRKNQHYPINEHKDLTDKTASVKFRQVIDARSSEAGGQNVVKFDKQHCIDNFARILDDCTCTEVSKSLIFSPYTCVAQLTSSSIYRR